LACSERQGGADVITDEVAAAPRWMAICCRPRCQSRWSRDTWLRAAALVVVIVAGVTYLTIDRDGRDMRLVDKVW
jgi:hypothetical protein